MIVLYDDTGRILGAVHGGRIDGNTVTVNGRPVLTGVRAKLAEVPDQAIAHLRTEGSDGSIAWIGRYPDDLADAPTAEQIKDAETAQAINRAMHPTRGVEEQLAICRKQLAAILDRLGEAPVPDFARYQQIVASKITEVRDAMP